MLAVIQRVKSSSVTVNNDIVGATTNGLLVLLGVANDDTSQDADYLVDKVTNLRIFEDENRKMNRSLLDVEGEMMVVSQFTLLGDCKKGRRPSFILAAGPERANQLYERFIDQVRQKDVTVATGQFGATMEVALINDGPVTLIIESR